MMGISSKWLICAGPSEFLFIAAALIATGSSGGVEWERSAERAYAQALEARSHTRTSVVVGGGIDGSRPEDVACMLSTLTDERTILCLPHLPAVSEQIAEHNVIAVEPAGLMKILIEDRAWQAGRDARSAQHNEQRMAPSYDPHYEDDLDEPEAPSFRDAARPQPAYAHMPPHASMVLPEIDVDGPAADMASGPAAKPVSGPAADVASDSAAEPPQHALRVSGQLPRVGVAETLAQQPQQNTPVPHAQQGMPSPPIKKEPVVWRPVVEMPQLECNVAGSEEHVPTICFTSARGGVGKTTLAVLSALALARDGLSVALIDLDFQFGTCLGYLGAEETDGLIEAGTLPEQVRLDARTLARCRATPERGLMAYEFCRAPEQAEVLSGMAGRLLRAARAGADVAIVDLPCGVNEAATQALEVADRCLFIADQRAFALESLAAQQSLCVRMGIARTKLVTVMNRCDPRHRDEGFLSRVRFEVQTPQIIRVVDGGSEVMQMISIGSAAELVNMRNRCALSTADLIHTICADVGCQMPQGAAVAPSSVPAAAVQAAPAHDGLFGKRRKERRGEPVPCPF